MAPTPYMPATAVLAELATTHIGKEGLSHVRADANKVATKVPVADKWGFKTPLIWGNIIPIAMLHCLTLYGVVTFPYIYHIKTFCFAVFMGLLGGFGVTAGAHRLWCHRSYRAKLPLRIFLVICYSIAGQNTLFDWVRDHRVHHKYSETDADPHNSNRGFFFAHVGWLMMKKHPDVLQKGKNVDCSDLWDDPVVVFHQKYFWVFKMLCCFIVPTMIPPLLWNESWYWAFMTQSVSRYCFNLNCTWLVNSAAHMWGYKPYNKKISPVESLGVAIAALGEGWHNYHHTFPWDYKAAELGKYGVNLTTMLIDFFAKIGWAYDLKCPSKDLIKRTALAHGDGSHPEWSAESDAEKKLN